MSERPQAKAGVLKIAPYVPGRSASGARETRAKLSSNESPLGASPKAIQALRALDDRLASYPEGSSRDLREALARKHDLEAERIVIGAGSDELLHLIAQTYLGEGDEAVISQYGFLVYPIATTGAGAVPVFASDKDYRVDVDAMLAAVTDRTRVVFLANPNNPTGTYLPDNEVRRLHAGLPRNVLFVLDSAYAEYVTAPDYDEGIGLVRENENVVMVRTFSKIGLAALRIGWLYGPDHAVDALNRLRGPFNVNMAAQLAGVAALDDEDFIAKLQEHNRTWRDYLERELAGNRVRVLPSEGNFVLALFPQSGPVTAASVNRALLDEGIVVREMGSYGLPEALRISIGTEAAMRDVVRIVRGMDNE